MTKRIVKSSNINIFKRFLSYRYSGSYSSVVEDPALAEQIKQLNPGCFVFVYEAPSGNVEAITMHKFDYAVSSMISKESAYNF